MADQLASRDPEQHPRCFLDVPQCGGASVHAALVAALPTATVWVKRMDTSTFCEGFSAFDELERERRETVLVEKRELDALARAGVVSGHFSLPTLLKVAPPEAIATVLREPRARLLSVYACWRLSPEANEMWHPYRATAHASRPLDQFLSEPLLAPSLDNVMCRMLLQGDPRIPALDFISPGHIEDLAADAVEWLDRLGFVGVLEHGQTTWDGLSRFFDITLVPTHLNVSESPSSELIPVEEAISGRTLELFHARSAADALVYQHVLAAQTAEAEAKRFSDATFAAQLVRFGDVAGPSAATAVLLSQRLTDAESQIAGLAERLGRREEERNARGEVVRLEEELARHRAWLGSVQGSVSWRITSPLRAAKRLVVRAKRT